jgi:hypothetical protein
MLSFYHYVSHLDTKKSELVKRFGHELFFLLCVCVFFSLSSQFTEPNVRNLNNIIKVLL